MGDRLEVDLGAIAYEAYRVASDGRSVITHQELPVWHVLPKQGRENWRTAADAVRMWLELHRHDHAPHDS